MPWGPGDPPNLLNELIFRQRGLEEFDLVTLLGQDLTAGLVDVLKEENLDVFCGEWLEVLRVDEGNDAVQRRAVAGGRVEGGGGGSSDGGHIVLTRTDI